MGMSNADRQRKYRQKRDASPNRRKEYLLKEKQKYKRDIETKKKKCVKDMTEREKRSARKRWRLYKQQVRAKQKKVSESKSPPKTPSSACSSHQKLSSKKKKKREEAKCYRENKLLKEKIINLEKKHAIYRKRLQRAKEQSSNDALKGNVLTPRSKTRKLLRNFSKKEVKRALLFHNALIDQLKLAHKLRPAVSPVPGILSGSIIRKYKLKSVAMRSCGIHTRNKLLQRSSLSRRMYKIVQEFYERDDVSRITAGMKNTVTKKKSKKQRRILCDSLQNLHQKYLSENPPMSYSTFCRLRPFWVLFPSERDRNTCQCKLCENTNFMFRALKNANVLEAQSLDELLEGREWNYDKKKRNDEIQWEEWTTKSEKREIKRGNKFERKNVTFTVKETFSNNVSNLVDKFDNQIKRYRSHSINIKNQYRYYKERKENLEENSCFILTFQKTMFVNSVMKYKVCTLGPLKSSCPYTLGSFTLARMKRKHLQQYLKVLPIILGQYGPIYGRFY